MSSDGFFTLYVCIGCKQDIADIATSKKQYVRRLLIWKVLCEADSRSIAYGIEERNNINRSGSEHDEQQDELTNDGSE
jgi:hypothetical protein